VAHGTAEHEQRLELLRRTIAERERDLSALQRTIQEQEQGLSRLKHDVIEREQALSSLQQSLGQQDASLVTLKQALLEHERALASLHESAAEDADRDKDTQIALAQALANATNDALLVTDESCRIVAMNASAEAMFGAENSIGQQLVEVTQLPELEVMVTDAMANEEEAFEEQLTFDRRHFRVRCGVVRHDGNQYVGLGLQDVSELVRLNRARRDMVANISHELRTPIANIRVIIDSLFHEQEKPKRKQSTSALKAIARETDSLLWLVQELLDLSMIESGQAILRMIDTPIQPLVADSFERMVDQSNAKDLTLAMDIPEGLKVLADSDLVRRVLINLIHNAIKWSPAGEKITVRAESTGDDEVIVSVADNGPGVPEEHRERIFERFYQIDTSRSGGEGTGLGLAISRHIIEHHGGRIWVEGNPDGHNGCGAYFRFTLPAADEGA
jgi:two-component system phosphate regulon sensor histidine kinase PhoR